MTPVQVNCIDCLHFDLRSTPAMAKQGYGACAKDSRPGRYESATFNRTCPMFEAGPVESSQKRRAWLAAEQQRFIKRVTEIA